MNPTIDTRRPRPLTLLLLPLWAGWHAVNGLWGFIHPADLGAFLLDATLWMLVAYGLALTLRHPSWRWIAAFTLGCWLLLYELVADALARVAPSFLYSYKVLPVLGIVLVLFSCALAARRWPNPLQLQRYLHWLLAALLLVEVVGSGVNWVRAAHEKPLFAGPSLLPKFARPRADKPDVYLLVLDEYAGLASLQQLGYDNRPFYDSLRALGLYVADSSAAHYNFTPFSVSSALQLRYLDSTTTMKGKDARTILRSVQAIGESDAFRMLESAGYRVRFLAPFDSRRNGRRRLNEFGDFSWRKLTGTTLVGRLRFDRGLSLFLSDRLFPPHIAYNDAAQRRADMDYYLSGFAQSIDSNAQRPPQAVYQHLLITHHPYLFDSLGRPRARMATTAEEQRAYLDQVRVANATVLNELRALKQQGRRNTVVFLFSDHGYREPGAGTDPFDNLQALYLPEGNYAGLDSAQGPVNWMRFAFNHALGQHWPLLPAQKVRIDYR